MKEKKDTVNNAKQKALASALGQIEKQFGKGSIMRYGDGPVQNIEAISTGSMALDNALGIGGVPRGRVVEIYGPEASGKTTVTLQIIAEAQKSGGICAFIDAEHALDPRYASNLGVDMDNLLLSQPDTGEQALEIVEKLVNSNALDLIVIDSVAALTPKAEIEGEMGDSLPGLQARLMSQAMRKITAAVSKSKTTVIFINQLRHKIGMMMPGQSPETTTGGNALKFYASVRMDVRRIGGLKKGDEHIGNQVRIRIIKNKMAPPFKNVVLELYFGQGFSREAEVIDMAVEEGIMTRAGAFYRYDGDVVGQGKENARNYLKENPQIMEEIKSKLKVNLPQEPLPSSKDEEKKGE